MTATFVERVAGPRGRLAGWRIFLLACGRRLGVGPGEVVVLLCDDEEIGALNQRFRGKEGPTDVLTFPDNGRSPGGAWHLGDIAISLEAARRQAARARRSLDDEVRRLLVHGLLHVLGYDHERDDGQMAELERDVWRSLRTRSGGA